MKTRPWPIVILALIHIFGPIGNIFLNSILQNLSPVIYLVNLFHTESVWGLIDFFALLPLAGLAIYSCKKWSYPIFLTIALWTVYSNVSFWSDSAHAFPGVILAISVILDVLFVSYFLIPAVRTTYFDARVRWWEQKPRYIVDIPTSLTQSDQPSQTALIRDIAEGGVFLESKATLDPKIPVHLSFSVSEQLAEVIGTLVYHRSGEHSGYGIKFNLTPDSSRAIQAITRILEKNNTPTRLTVNLKADFALWFSRFIKSGKGLIPEVPNRK